MKQFQHWYVGFDEREKDAYDVCVHSLLRHSTVPIRVHPLKHRQLRNEKLFWREWKIDGQGQYWDLEDGKPFSTEFAFTRFLVPHLCKREGIDGWVFFVDADFLFLDDVAKLGELTANADPSLAVMCVQHDFRPKQTIKMDGLLQSPYSRKNWSSLIAFNANHPRNDMLTPHNVSTATGSWLHGFEWLTDDMIGSLPPEWNRLVGHFNESLPVSALHYTNGGPWFEDWKQLSQLEDLWTMELNILKHPSPTTRQKQLEAAE